MDGKDPPHEPNEISELIIYWMKNGRELERIADTLERLLKISEMRP